MTRSLFGVTLMFFFCGILEELSFEKADITVLWEKFSEYRTYVVKGED